MPLRKKWQTVLCSCPGYRPVCVALPASDACHMADHMNRKYWWRQCAEHLSFGNHFNAATSTSVLQSRVGITAICFAVAFPAISQPFAGLQQQHFHDLFDKQLPSRAKPTTQAGATHKSVASNDPREPSEAGGLQRMSCHRGGHTNHPWGMPEIFQTFTWTFTLDGRSSYLMLLVILCAKPM